MFDVGGQRDERRKWIQCFNDVTAIIFGKIKYIFRGFLSSCFSGSHKFIQYDAQRRQQPKSSPRGPFTFSNNLEQSMAEDDICYFIFKQAGFIEGENFKRKESPRRYYIRYNVTFKGSGDPKFYFVVSFPRGH